MKGDERHAGRDRAVGCLGLLLVVVAVPIAVVGSLIYLNSEEAGTANSGVAGGLAGLGVAVGVGALAVAALVFIAGAVLYVRSAGKDVQGDPGADGS